MSKDKNYFSSSIGKIVPGGASSPPPRKKKPSGGKKRKPAARKRSRIKSTKVRIFILFAKLASAALAAMFIVGFLLVAMYAHDLPDINNLYGDKLKKSIQIVDREGNNIAVYGDLFTQFVQYKDLPKTLVDAVVATEDRRFFDHMGIDPIGIARAAGANLVKGGVRQGGSTVTQQLAKIVFLKPERKLKRKIQEAILAVWLEHKFTKEQIMAMYLNRVYLGSGVYGVDAASRRYFGKSVKQINLYESALLAGLLKAPTTYSPYNSPKASVTRTRQVLANMVDAGKISEYDKNRALVAAAKIELHQPRESNKYFADYIAEQVQQYIGDSSDNLIVKTTFDSGLQKLADDSLTRHMLESGDKLRASQGAIVAMKPNGEVIAMVGGLDYSESQFNRATQAQRQPGSLFKMFVYLAAMENGFEPDSQIEDAPISVGKWRPSNYDGQLHGLVSLRDALAKSYNLATVHLALDVGIGKIVNTAKRLGIESPLVDTPSVALGSSEVNLLEITSAYAVLANNGRKVEPYAINEIITTHGKVLYKRKSTNNEQIIDYDAVKKMNNMLLSVTRYGTGRGANIGRDVAGKTGTSQDSRDAWFVGYTPQLVAGVWVGNDNNKPMKNVTGGALPARIWADFSRPALTGVPATGIDENYSRGFESDVKGFWESIVGE